MENFDAVITDTPTLSKGSQIAFVGNGKIGSNAYYGNPSLYVFYDKTEKTDSLSETVEMLRFVNKVPN